MFQEKDLLGTNQNDSIAISADGILVADLGHNQGSESELSLGVDIELVGWPS